MTSYVLALQCFRINLIFDVTRLCYFDVTNRTIDSLIRRTDVSPSRGRGTGAQTSNIFRVLQCFHLTSKVLNLPWCTNIRLEVQCLTLGCSNLQEKDFVDWSIR